MLKSTIGALKLINKVCGVGPVEFGVQVDGVDWCLVFMLMVLTVVFKFMLMVLTLLCLSSC